MMAHDDDAARTIAADEAAHAAVAGSRGAPPPPPLRNDVWEGPTPEEAKPETRALGEAPPRTWTYALTGAVGESSSGPSWVPDVAVKNCSSCYTEFGFFLRKHHCRYCGRVYCYKCSSQTLLLPETFGVREPQRVCEPCGEELKPMQEQLRRVMAVQSQTTDFDPDAVSKYSGSPVCFDMCTIIKQAAHTTSNFFGHTINGSLHEQEHQIPIALLKQAKGIAFLTVVRGGFMFSGRFGTGLVVARTDDGSWSAPSAIATIGFGWGALIGADITEYVIVLNTRRAVDTFSGAGQVQLGAELGVALGPVGRSAEGSVNVGDGGLAPCYAYSHSKGLFAGVSLEGAVISARPDVNRKFYGTEYERGALLSGSIKQPVAAAPLYQTLDRALGMPSS